MVLSDRIVAVESGGNATAKNPRSSATGAGQFIDGTWLDMVKRYRPDLAGGSREQVLALRNDPTLSKEMVQHYAEENGQKLQAAGLPVTDGTKYLAHFAGPGGAISVLSADPGTPVAEVLPASAVAANPFLRGWSALQLADWAARKVGGEAPKMQMPDAAPTRGAFGLSGPVAAGTPGSVTPAGGETMRAPAAAEPGLDVAALMRLLVEGASPLAQAGQPAPAAPPPQAAPQRAAPTFDASRFFALLPAPRTRR